MEEAYDLFTSSFSPLPADTFILMDEPLIMVWVSA